MKNIVKQIYTYIEGEDIIHDAKTCKEGTHADQYGLCYYCKIGLKKYLKPKVAPSTNKDSDE